jgi:hypothetical protein
MSEINPGDIVRVLTTPGFKNASGVLTDPTTITLRWRVAGGAETAWVFGVDAEIVKDSTGVYHADIPIALPGLHYFRWEGTGTVVAAEESTFNATSLFPVLGP